jgi:CBS domain-containing membrane protein
MTQQANSRPPIAITMSEQLRHASEHNHLGAPGVATASGMAAGALVGVAAGPLGSLAGALLGGLVGATAGFVLDRDERAPLAPPLAQPRREPQPEAALDEGESWSEIERALESGPVSALRWRASLEDRTVSDLMSPRPVVLPSGVSVEDALSLLRERRIRHVPIVDDTGRLLGLLRQSDLEAPRAGPGGYTVGERLDTSCAMVSPDAPAALAASYMLRTKTDCLVVIDDTDVIVGVLTEADFIRAWMRQFPAGNEPEGTIKQVRQS